MPLRSRPLLSLLSRRPSSQAHHRRLSSHLIRSSSSPSTTTYMDPRPSSSVILLSPANEVLLLQRVHTASSFASAHVFPGGNLDAFHDGPIPAPSSPDRHRDGPAYRLAALRECFEETGILLASASAAPGSGLLNLPQELRDVARRQIHAGQVSFGDWLRSVDGVANTDALIPFTRWLTPANVKKRFTTQMYLYMLPLSRSPDVPSEMLIPTPDDGVEHTSAQFASPQSFLARSAAGSIVLMPPQAYLLSLLTRFITATTRGLSPEELAAQRERLLAFLGTTPTADTERGKAHPTASIPWADKLISPHNLFVRQSDNRVVLGLDKPGPELKGSGRGGDWERVAIVRFTKAGASEVEIRRRQDALEEERRFAASKI
ncbi:hypothetical protein B0I35DRAFT_435181 [Stachybotrys elegans]|uniref:Nudix hydrolase domain-containing protein n=1 Tax=Stachybotrys elegans TaxID=80388 RepID=A0A8K0SP89_9HYPO|nr:hypothetical protein B0I35DRAFT_435181 [Stachybotrys elegans]